MSEDIKIKENKNPLSSAHYERTKMQKEMIIERLREKGCRITRQRLLILDTILENQCSSCKEIFYRVSEVNSGIGAATVYRMINTLEEIGAISRKNMYRIAYSEHCTMEDACTVVLEDNTTFHLSAKTWNLVVQAGLGACGFMNGQKVASISVKPCSCSQTKC